MKTLAILLLVFHSAASLQAQDVDPAANPPAPESTAAVKTRAPANADQLLANLLKEEKDAKLRIKEIEGVIFPIQDEIAQKLFFFNPGEYAFLRMQSETGKTSAKFFEAQGRIDQDSWEGVADALDLAYESLRSGKLWVGRETSLVSEDTALFNDLKGKVMAAILERPDGQKIIALIEEREKLMNRSKTSGPMLKYLGERRQWWKAYPDYVKTVQENSALEQ